MGDQQQPFFMFCIFKRDRSARVSGSQNARADGGSQSTWASIGRRRTEHMGEWWSELSCTYEEKRKLLNMKSIGDTRFWVSYLKAHEHLFSLFVFQFGPVPLEIA
jgi:hypothetical protein